MRPCNAVTKKLVLALPLIQNCISACHGMTIFSKLDVKSAFWQFLMRECDIPLTAFITPFGLFESLRMVFGLTNAPATCQRLTNKIVLNIQRLIFEHRLTDQCSVSGYIDDFLLAAKSRAVMLQLIVFTLQSFVRY